MHTNMKVLQELGIKVVAGDIIDGVNITQQYAELHNKFGQRDDFVSEFAWRDNDGDQPVGDDVVVEVECESKDTGADVARAWDWYKHGAYGDLIKWRPCLKSLTEVGVTPKPEPKPEEPDFTASAPKAVFSLGYSIEKPKHAGDDLAVEIGGEYEYSWTGNVWHPCTIIDIGEVGHTVRTKKGLLLLIEKGAFGFRSIKSDRDIAIDEMCKIAPLDATRNMMGNLYDAGYRKSNA